MGVQAWCGGGQGERAARPAVPASHVANDEACVSFYASEGKSANDGAARRSSPSPRVRQFHLPRVVLGVFSGHGHLSHLSHPRGRPFKKFSAGIFVGWFVITPPPLPSSFFSRFNLGVAKVAKVAMSQKSHKVRVERSGATLGRRRVVNLLTQVRVYPRAGGARALPDVGRCSTWCRDPPSHVLHARRARRWRARVSRRRGGRPGGGTQRARLAIDPMCAP